jgi:hypothetical protein
MKKLAILLLIIFSICALSHAAQDPPPNWNPAGQSVAGPGQTSDAVQTAERSSADEQIRYGRDKQAQQKSGNQGYIYYTDAFNGEYYRDPFYPYDRRGPITPKNLHSYVSYGPDPQIRRRDVYIHTD